MIGVDTNVLVRYLTEDDRAQTRAAARAIEAAADTGSGIYVNDIVVCELVWVLDSAYGFARDRIAAVLDAAFEARQFEFEDKPALLEALAGYRASKAGFADCLIGVKNRRAGCEATVTFDREAARLGEYRLLAT